MSLLKAQEARELSNVPLNSSTENLLKVVEAIANLRGKRFYWRFEIKRNTKQYKELIALGYGVESSPEGWTIISW